MGENRIYLLYFAIYDNMYRRYLWEGFPSGQRDQTVNLAA